MSDEIDRLNSALDMVAEEREAWKKRASQLSDLAEYEAGIHREEADSLRTQLAAEVARREAVERHSDELCAQLATAEAGA